MNKEELLSHVGRAFQQRGIRFPAAINFEENQRVLTLSMKKDSVTENMQTDSAAFEGWALCLKAIPSLNIERVCLAWEKPDDFDDLKGRHYQRFLYRVDRFRRIFGGECGWFCIHSGCEPHLAALEIKDGQLYCLNYGKTSRAPRPNSGPHNEENELEHAILAQQTPLSGLSTLCPVKLQRQLPVGLFRENVCEANAIFPDKHSAVDLWGVAGNDLYLLELKAKGNCKVGALSELFFYAMVLRDEQLKMFARGDDSEASKQIEGTNHIKAFLLAPGRHPLVTPGTFNLINETTKKLGIEFGHIAFKYKREHGLTFQSFTREC
jgi:hypothetical protein